MAYGQEGKMTRLVPLEKEKHLENALVWLNDPETTRWALTGDFPLTRLKEEEYFDKIAKAGETTVGLAIETLEGEHIGFTGIDKIEWRHGVGLTGTIIAPPDRWGKGYGTDSVLTRTRYAFETLGLRLLLSEVIGGNDASLRVLAKAGYREIGRIPERYWCRGAYRDLILFCVSREEAGRQDRK